MNQKVKRTRRDHSLSFKLAVVEQVGKGEMTYCQAQNRGQPYHTVLNWLNKRLTRLAHVLFTQKVRNQKIENRQEGWSGSR
ncbi:hypothetical protein A3M43_21465 [Salmonella enterica]|nr:hypothetical protein [Salmonella enterica]EBP3746185.1 hypothetical protein [Salmonella enterica subsp. arizonae]ECI5661327.1 hypothetical protein [Salmonella enterica subsp. diarizonae]EBR3968235.1 hypothetical protein [Salmonella enterica]EDL7784466.1 hypothetical protein [Salmonella enterica]